jgi:hypothetical protein
MDHSKLDTTKQYYHVGKARRRGPHLPISPPRSARPTPHHAEATHQRRQHHNAQPRFTAGRPARRPATRLLGVTPDEDGRVQTTNCPLRTASGRPAHPARGARPRPHGSPRANRELMTQLNTRPTRRNAPACPTCTTPVALHTIHLSALEQHKRGRSILLARADPRRIGHTGRWPNDRHYLHPPLSTWPQPGPTDVLGGVINEYTQVA